ncbi:MAG: hypothetical protein F7C36_00370 [Desulfurococcales archaeon]|nr:hypothetical protein [Desulfurococcales archaeon]
MGLRPPKRVTLAFVHRKTGNVHKRKTFEFRNEHQAILKMAAWVTGMIQEGFTPKQYRLIAFVDARNGVPSLVVNILKRSNVEVHVDSIELAPQQTNGAWFEWG